MKSIDKIEHEIYRIGKNMVRCKKGCEGVAEPKNGVLPRCLYLERDGRDCRKRGVIIVGVNPGWAKGPEGDHERDEYRKIQKLPSNKWYGAIVSYWKKHVKDDNPYYTNMRNFLDQVNCKGPLLWTELVKCQNGDHVKTRDIPTSTFDVCTKEYLRKELDQVPTWPIITIGNDAYRDYKRTELSPRKLLGLYHTTNSRSPYWFCGMFKKDGHVRERKLRKKLRKDIIDFLDNPVRRAVKVVFRNGVFLLDEE